MKKNTHSGSPRCDPGGRSLRMALSPHGEPACDWIDEAVRPALIEREPHIICSYPLYPTSRSP